MTRGRGLYQAQALKRALKKLHTVRYESHNIPSGMQHYLSHNNTANP